MTTVSRAPAWVQENNAYLTRRAMTGSGAKQSSGFSAAQHQFAKSPWRTWMAMYCIREGNGQNLHIRPAGGRQTDRWHFSFRRQIEYLAHEESGDGLDTLRPVQVTQDVSPRRRIVVLQVARLEVRSQNGVTEGTAASLPAGHRRSTGNRSRAYARPGLELRCAPGRAGGSRCSWRVPPGS